MFYATPFLPAGSWDVLNTSFVGPHSFGMCQTPTDAFLFNLFTGHCHALPLHRNVTFSISVATKLLTYIPPLFSTVAAKNP